MLVKHFIGKCHCLTTLSGRVIIVLNDLELLKVGMELMESDEHLDSTSDTWVSLSVNHLNFAFELAVLDSNKSIVNLPVLRDNIDWLSHTLDSGGTETFDLIFSGEWRRASLCWCLVLWLNNGEGTFGR